MSEGLLAIFAAVVLAMLGVFMVWNFIWSLNLSYLNARDLNDGGYPILAHAAFTFGAFFHVLVILREFGWDSVLPSGALAIGWFGSAILHVWLIYRFRDMGNQERESKQKDS